MGHFPGASGPRGGLLPQGWGVLCSLNPFWLDTIPCPGSEAWESPCHMSLAREWLSLTHAPPWGPASKGLPSIRALSWTDSGCLPVELPWAWRVGP